MNMKIIFIVMFLLGMASCYDDKGNYDYKEMNDIEVSVSTETSYPWEIRLSQNRN